MDNLHRSPVIGVSGSESVAVSLEPARGGSGDKDTLPSVFVRGAAVTVDEYELEAVCAPKASV